MTVADFKEGLVEMAVGAVTGNLTYPLRKHVENYFAKGDIDKANEFAENAFVASMLANAAAYIGGTYLLSGGNENYTALATVYWVGEVMGRGIVFSRNVKEKLKHQEAPIKDTSVFSASPLGKIISTPIEYFLNSNKGKKASLEARTK